MGREIAGGQTPDIVAGIDAVRTSKIAARMFTDASRTYPASASAQGASILLQLRERGLDISPLHMGRVLAEDTDAVSRLAVTANDMHRSRGTRRVVSENDVTRIIGASFAHAFFFSNMDSDTLQSLLSFYDDMRGSGARFHEPRYRTIVYETINATPGVDGQIHPISQSLVTLTAKAISGDLEDIDTI